MNITLTWTTGSGASSQDVQYKLASAGSWTTHVNVAGNITTTNINGLQDNLIYDFRVITNCAGGTPTASTAAQQIKIICPTITTTPSDTTIGYSFPEIGGSVTAYTAKLFDSAGTTEIASQTPSGTTTRSGTFTGLSASTAYKVRVLITAGAFSKNDCAFTSVSTTATPACNAPTNVSASIAETSYVLLGPVGGLAGSSSAACSNYFSSRSYYSPQNFMQSNVTYIYDDSAMTTPLDTGGQWKALSFDGVIIYAVITNSSGLVTNYTTCSAP